MLFEDEEDKQSALSTSIMKRVTALPQCKSKNISYRAIDHLKIVSELVR